MPDVHSHPAEVPFEQIAPSSFPDRTTSLSVCAPGERVRVREDLGEAGIIDAALTRRDSDTLIVTFHGALDRDKYTIPRFERVRTTEPFNTSCLYWSDPSLWLDDSLALSWYTGAGDLDLFTLLADRSCDIAQSIDAQRIIFTGSSGGGFAALQTSALVPGSTALVFNPQTAISRYWQTVQRKYLEVCQPNVLAGLAGDFDFSADWSESLGDRFSAVRRYSARTRNDVHYWTNTNDWHHAKHFRPFRDVTKESQSSLNVHAYSGAKGHHTPSSDLFTGAMKACLAAAEESA